MTAIEAVIPEGLRTSPAQLDLLRHVRDYFRAEGLLAEGDASLFDCCPRCEACWRPGGRRRQPAAPEPPYHPRLPAIGADYPRSRVAVLGMNTRDDGRIDAELRTIVWAQDDFRAGNRRWHASYFHYRTASSLAALLAIRAGTTAVERPEPAELVSVLDATARLQAIQCSPDDASGRRSPTGQMRLQCEPYLAGQLAIVKPETLLLLGGPPRWSIERLFHPKWQSDGRLKTAQIQTDWASQVAVYAIPHPAHGWWHAAHRALVARANEEATV